MGTFLVGTSHKNEQEHSPKVPHEKEKQGTPLIYDPNYVDPYMPDPYQ